MKSLSLVVLALVSLVSLKAHATIEIRGHYGSLMGKPKAYNDAQNAYASGTPAIDAETVFGADAVYVLPSKQMDLGLRYEMFSFSKESAGTYQSTAVTAKTKLDGSRISVIGDYHLINNPGFRAGVNASVGVSQAADTEQSLTNAMPFTLTRKFKAEMGLSYGVAAQASLRFNRVLIGTELGYLSMKGTVREDSTGAYLKNTGETVDFDLSGPYYRLVIGYSI